MPKVRCQICSKRMELHQSIDDYDGDGEPIHLCSQECLSKWKGDDEADDNEEAQPKANQIQYGGRHYKQADNGEEHWDRIWRTRGVEGGRGYFIGCITKYVERYDKKNGIEDLKKAAHYIQKLIELETELLSKGTTNV